MDYLLAHPFLCRILAVCLGSLLVLLCLVQWDTAEYDGNDF